MPMRTAKKKGRRKMPREAQKRVSEKIEVLRRGGEDPRQAAATAYSMERAGRLRRHGEYVHVRARGKRKSTGRR